MTGSVVITPISIKEDARHAGHCQRISLAACVACNVMTSVTQGKVVKYSDDNLLANYSHHGSVVRIPAVLTTPKEVPKRYITPWKSEALAHGAQSRGAVKLSLKPV